MTSIHVYLSHSSEETKSIAQQFSKELSSGSIFCLYGDLGNGKTTFVQGLAEGLEIKKRIISPTFTIVRQYKVLFYSSSESGITPDESRSLREGSSRSRSRGARTINFFHIDLYRTNSIEDIKGLGFEEILSEKTAIIAIEWAEKLGSLLPEKRTDIRFEYIDENRRKITIQQLT